MTAVRFVGQLFAAALGWIIGLVLVAGLVGGGLFYRTECPSHASWTLASSRFSRAFRRVIRRARSRKTATAYYSGKVPVAFGGVAEECDQQFQAKALRPRP